MGSVRNKILKNIFFLFLSKLHEIISMDVKLRDTTILPRDNYFTEKQIFQREITILPRDNYFNERQLFYRERTILLRDLLGLTRIRGLKRAQNCPSE